MLFSAEGGGAIVEYVERLFPPDLSGKVVADAVAGAWETLAISLIGTLLSVVIALSLAFFGSRNLVYAVCSTRWSPGVIGSCCGASRI